MEKSTILEICDHKVSDSERLEMEFQLLRQSVDKMRKALFARSGEVKKTVDNMMYDYENLKSAICKGNIYQFKSES